MSVDLGQRHSPRPGGDKGKCRSDMTEDFKLLFMTCAMTLKRDTAIKDYIILVS